MQTYSHVCSCGEKYEDNDPDVYFCSKCVEQRKAIAKLIDAKVASRPKKEAVSNYKIAVERGQSRGGVLFVRASDLGIL